MIELSLFRVRSFAVANLGGFLFALGFYALLLCNVLFLTGVWGYSILRAGVALTPGPLLAALSAPIGGRLSDRFGQRAVAVPGAIVFGAGGLLFALAIEHEHSYAEFLPATLLTGTGVGLTFAAVGSAAVAELPRAWALIAPTGALSAATGLALGRVRARDTTEETVGEGTLEPAPADAIVADEPAG